MAELSRQTLIPVQWLFAARKRADYDFRDPFYRAQLDAIYTEMLYPIQTSAKELRSCLSGCAGFTTYRIQGETRRNWPLLFGKLSFGLSKSHRGRALTQLGGLTCLD